MLEFAIGTGRVALPLRERGVDVHGIDLSEAMVARLRAKPGGADVPVVIGDFSSTFIGGVFDLVYVVFNTLGNVTSQDAQIETFTNAARHLRPGVASSSRSRCPACCTGSAVSGSGCSDTTRVASATTSTTSSHSGCGRTTSRSGRRNRRTTLHPVSLRLACRDGPDGSLGRHAAAGTLGVVGPFAVHRQKRVARLGVAEVGMRGE